MLALSVISPQGQSLGANSYQLFDESGGVIGRSADSRMVLPDPTKTVSGHHARIRCQNGAYFVIDESTNGTYLNSPDRRLPRGQPYELSDGDRLIIGDYEIVAQILQTTAPPRQVPAPAPRNPWEPAGDGAGSPGAPLPMPEPPSQPYPIDRPSPGFERGDTFEVDDFISMGRGNQASTDTGRGRFGSEVSPQIAGGSVFEEHYAPPPLQPAPDNTGPIRLDDLTGYAKPPPVETSPTGRGYTPPPAPDTSPTGRGYPPTPAGLETGPTGRGYGLSPRPSPVPPALVPSAPPAAPLQTPPQPPPWPQPAAHVPAAGSAHAVLEGLGLNPAQVSPEVAQQLGQILRVVVQGVVDVLQARAEVKNQFRLDLTQVRSKENNPLKHAANADHALQILFLVSNPAFLPPVAAFEDAFRDLRFHQIAMLAGIRAAFDAMLKKFDPETLEPIFERKGKRAALVDFGGKGRYWELYRERFADMTEDAEANFQRLFGEEFARAYTDQLKRLAAPAQGARR